MNHDLFSIFFKNQSVVLWTIAGALACRSGITIHPSPPTPNPTLAPTLTVSNNFNITIGNLFYDLHTVATTNIPGPFTGIYTQRLYVLSGGGTTLYFHVPIAGHVNTDGLPIGDWSSSDFYSGWGYSIGKYNASSWVISTNHSFQVSYTNGDDCADTGQPRHGTVRFLCSSQLQLKYFYQENPVCVCKCLVCLYEIILCASYIFF